MELPVTIRRSSFGRGVLNDVAMEGMGRMMGCHRSPPTADSKRVVATTPPSVPGSVLKCQGHSSICSGRLTDSSNGPPHDHEILNQRPVLNVEEVEPDRLLP